MKTKLFNLTLVVQALSSCLLLAQDPEKKPETETKPEAKQELRLTGEWELYQGDRPTGLLLDLRQVSYRVHGNYGNIRPSEKLGIRRGKEFFRASINGDQAKGEIVLRTINKETKELETRTNPFRFKILENGDRLDCEIGGDKVKENQKKFTLRRSATVKNFRLLVKTADGWQPSAKVVENMPMAIQAELTNSTRKPFTFTVTNGNKSIKLKATYVAAKDRKGKSPEHIARTPLFLPTFGRQLGVEENPKKSKEEEFGREPTDEDWKTLHGIWRAGYIDKELGEINGWIDFYHPVRKTFSYLEPETENWKELELVKAGILESKDPSMPRKWKFQFDGWGVTSEKVEPTKKEDLTELLLDPNVLPVTIKHEEREASVEIERSDIADFRTLYMELAEQKGKKGNELLVFNWRYTASRETNRDRNGLGRVGEMEVTDPHSTVGTMKGREAWMKNVPSIIATFCVDNQFDTKEAVHYDGDRVYTRNVPRYLYADMPEKRNAQGYLVRKKIPRDDGSRRIFIVATNLPENFEKRIFIKPDKDSDIDYYQIIDKGTEKEANDKKGLASAWKKYRNARKIADEAPPATKELTYSLSSAPSETATHEAVSQLENMSQSPPYGVLVRAVLKKGAKPGKQKLTMNDVPSAWKLDFGDTVASPQWLRKLATGEANEASEWEPITVAFRPEVVFISLRAQAAVEAQKQMYASVLVNKTRKAIFSEGDKINYKIPLTPDPKEPNRYISPPIHLVSEANLDNALKANPKHIFIACHRDDKLTAEFQSRTLYTIAPKKTQLTVATTPDSMNALWKVAVKKAADVAGIEVVDFDMVTKEEVEEATNYIVTHFFVPGASVKQKIKIRLGDHAAMLMLRDVFVEMMTEQLNDWARNQSAQKTRAVFRGHSAAIEARQSPLSYYRVPLQNLPQFRGTDHDDEIYLWQLFDKIHMEVHYDYTDDIDALRFAAFSYAWRNYGKDMMKTINDARKLKDSDIHGLLKLTGYSFEPIVRRLIPRLMKLEIDAKARTQQWVPDRVARAYVNSLSTLGSAVKAQADYSKAASNYVLTLVSIATIPFGNVGGFWTAAALAGIAAIDLGHTVYHDVYQQWDMDGQIRDEVARGAVLGVDRAAERQSERLAGWQQALSVGGSLLGGVTDGAAVLKALKGVKSAKILEAGAEILKRADFADPKVLRSLSEGDQAIIKTIADQAAELVRQGKVAELTDLQRKALSQAEELDIIFKNSAVKNVEKLNADELATRGADIAKKTKLDDVDALKNLDEADLTTLRRIRDEAQKLQKAGKADELTDLQKSVLNQSKKLDDAYDATPKGALQKQIADRFAAASKPLELDELSKRATDLTKKAEDLKAITKNAKSNANTAKKAYENALDAARKAPSKETTELVQKTGKTYREAKKSADLVNDLTGDITQRAQAAKSMLKEAEAGKAVRTTKADDRLLTLNNGKSGIGDFIKRQKSNPTGTFTKSERDMMRQISGLKKSDVKAVEDLVKANGGDWSDISKLAGGTGNDMLNMHRISAYRRLKMNKIADEAINETRAFLKNSGVSEADMIALERNAFGSANLTSDYDVAIRGTGAELAVQKFNEKARRLFKGTESGAVVDTNLYTDPIYNIFKQSEMTGKIGNLTAQEVDKARQFVFLQMANAKHRIKGDITDPASMLQWQKYKDNILKGVPKQARESMSDMMDQALNARNAAEKRIANRMGDVADAAKNVDGNAKLRVTNDLYGETLQDIHQYRRMLEDIDLVKQGKKNIRDIDLPPVLHDPKFAGQLNEIDKLMKNPATRARGVEELDAIRRQAAINIRSKQGEALYYASEAYQTRGTIGHVVDEMQAGGQAVTLKSLEAGRNTDNVRKSVLSVDDYINSYYENGGMLMKELNGKKVLDNAGNLKSGLDQKYYNKAAQKVAKYFERQLDAAAKSGVDMNKLFQQNPQLRETADFALQLAVARREGSKAFSDTMQSLFKNAKNADQTFVKRAMDFNELLEGQVITNSAILGYANKLADTEKAVSKSAVKLGKTWEPYVSLGGKTMQTSRAVSDGLANANDDFENQYRNDLQELAGKRRMNQPLTGAEVQRLRSHQKRFMSLRELNTQAAAARSAGVPPGQIDQAIRQAKQASPDNWQNAAATQINKSLQQKAATASDSAMNNASVSANLSRRLGLKNPPSQASSAEALANQLKRSGKYVTSNKTPLKLTQLGAQANAGRQAVVMMRDADGKTSWQEIRGITTDSAGRRLVRIRDASTGNDVTMPAALFNLRSNNAKHQIVIDPHRNTDGSVLMSQN